MTTAILRSEAEALQADIVGLRRQIHRHPELGLQLPRTQATILEALRGLGLRIRTGERLTSVVATLDGARPVCLAAAGTDCFETSAALIAERGVGGVPVLAAGTLHARASQLI